MAAFVASISTNLAAQCVISTAPRHLGFRANLLKSSCTPAVHRAAAERVSFVTRAAQHTVTVQHKGKKYELKIDEDTTILDAALDAGLDMPHDCRTGVCMTCPARVVSGNVERESGMLSEEVVAKGYALMCSSYARSNCTVATIEEDELLDEVMATSG
eukprot:jgi/Mesvir1/12359/Mv00542-RA.1